MPRKELLPEPRPNRPLPHLMLSGRHRGFHTEIGFNIDFANSRHGVCTVTGRIEALHLNVNDVVHGGVYSTILDTAMGGAVVSVLARGETTATTSLYVEYLRAAREGDTLTARGEVLRRGRHIAFAEGNLYDGQQRRLSQARGTWYIWSGEAPSVNARSAPRRRRSRATRGAGPRTSP